MSQEKTSSTVSISFKDMFKILWQKKWLVAIILVVSVIAAVVYGLFFQKDKYVSNAKIIVINSSDTGKISSNDVSTANNLVVDYAEFVVDRTVLEEVGKQISPKLSFEQLRSYVNINVPEGSHILEIQVTTGDPQYSKSIADKICEIAKGKIYEIIGVDKVNVFGPASLPKSSSIYSIRHLAVLGFGAGAVLSVVLAFAFLILSDILKNDEEIEEALGLPILSHIPYNPLRAASGKTSKRKAGK